MPAVLAENVLLLADDLLTPCKSEIGFRTNGKGGERLVWRPVSIKNATSAFVSSPLKYRDLVELCGWSRAQERGFILKSRLEISSLKKLY